MRFLNRLFRKNVEESEQILKEINADNEVYESAVTFDEDIYKSKELIDKADQYISQILNNQVLLMKLLINMDENLTYVLKDTSRTLAGISMVLQKMR